MISSLYSSRKVNLTENSCASARRWSNIWDTALGTIPADSGGDAFLALAANPSPPSMVYVLPVPVWPYAKIVQLNPRRTSSTTGRTASSYTSACDAAGPKTRSNAYVFSTGRPATDCETTHSPSASRHWTVSEAPLERSESFMGLVVVTTYVRGKRGEEGEGAG